MIEWRCFKRITAMWTVAFCCLVTGMPTFAGARHGMDRGEVEALPAIASAHPSMTGLDDSQRYHRKVHMKKAYMRSVHDYVLPELPLLTMSGS